LSTSGAAGEELLGELCCFNAASLSGRVVSPPILKTDFCPIKSPALGDALAVGEIGISGVKSRPILDLFSTFGIRPRGSLPALTAAAEGDNGIGDNAAGDFGLGLCPVGTGGISAFGEICNEIALRAPRPFPPSTGNKVCGLNDLLPVLLTLSLSGLLFVGELVLERGCLFPPE
jgi:hypothetical protein